MDVAFVDQVANNFRRARSHYRCGFLPVGVPAQFIEGDSAGFGYLPVRDVGAGCRLAHQSGVDDESSVAAEFNMFAHIRDLHTLGVEGCHDDDGPWRHDPSPDVLRSRKLSPFKLKSRDENAL